MRKISWLEVYVKPLLENKMYLYPNDFARIFLDTLIKMHSYTGRYVSSDKVKQV